jgi:hypothetical protein
VTSVVRRGVWGTGATRVKDGGASGQWVCCVVQAYWVTV